MPQQCLLWGTSDYPVSKLVWKYASGCHDLSIAIKAVDWIWHTHTHTLHFDPNFWCMLEVFYESVVQYWHLRGTTSGSPCWPRMSWQGWLSQVPCTYDFHSLCDQVTTFLSVSTILRNQVIELRTHVFQRLGFSECGSWNKRNTDLGTQQFNNKTSVFETVWWSNNVWRTHRTHHCRYQVANKQPSRPRWYLQRREAALETQIDLLTENHFQQPCSLQPHRSSAAHFEIDTLKLEILLVCHICSFHFALNKSQFGWPNVHTMWRTDQSNWWTSFWSTPLHPLRRHGGNPCRSLEGPQLISSSAWPPTHCVASNFRIIQQKMSNARSYAKICFKAFYLFSLPQQFCSHTRPQHSLAE